MDIVLRSARNGWEQKLERMCGMGLLGTHAEHPLLFFNYFFFIRITTKGKYKTKKKKTR